MKKRTSQALTAQQKTELAALESLPDQQIDTSDIPEILDWSGARRGALYRPVKQQLTLRLDADVVAWFRANGRNDRGYQTEINRVLREHAKSASSRSQLSPPGKPGVAPRRRPDAARRRQLLPFTAWRRRVRQ